MGLRVQPAFIPSTDMNSPGRLKQMPDPAEAGPAVDARLAVPARLAGFGASAMGDARRTGAALP